MSGCMRRRCPNEPTADLACLDTQRVVGHHLHAGGQPVRIVAAAALDLAGNHGQEGTPALGCHNRRALLAGRVSRTGAGARHIGIDGVGGSDRRPPGQVQSNSVEVEGERRPGAVCACRPWVCCIRGLHQPTRPTCLVGCGCRRGGRSSDRARPIVPEHDRSVGVVDHLTAGLSGADPAGHFCAPANAGHTGGHDLHGKSQGEGEIALFLCVSALGERPLRWSERGAGGGQDYRSGLGRSRDRICPDGRPDDLPGEG